MLRSIVHASLAASITLVAVAGPASNQDPGRLTIDRLVAIKHPSNPLWSPDGKKVAFVWDEGGVGNLYVVEASAANSNPRRLTSLKEGQVGGAFWSKDGSAILYPKDGSLWQVAIASGDSRPVWNGVRGSGFALSPDGTEIAFVRHEGAQGADLCIRSLPAGDETRMAHDPVSIGMLIWAPDGKHIVFNAGSETVIHDQTPAYSGSKIIYTITERTNGHLAVVPVSGGASVDIDAPAGYGGLRWIDASHLVLDRTSADFKTDRKSVV